MTTVDMVAVAKDAVEAATPRSAQVGIGLSFMASKESVSLTGDPGRLGQVLDNLISNAIKYSSEGGVVSVRVITDATECTVEVEDHGMGIALEDQNHVFERFFRASSAVDLQIQGVGLGLMVVKTIVDAHGGRVGFESTPGSGSTFRIVLPLDSTSNKVAPMPNSELVALADS
jgi:two-component system phosphate regulon sensor histidine kinase PhoR